MTSEADDTAAAAAEEPAAPAADAPAEGDRPSEAHAHSDVATAMRNTLKLGLSLMATWAVALGVRFILPRFLGPERFGQYAWAESTAALAFIFAGLGLVWATRPETVKAPVFKPAPIAA